MVRTMISYIYNSDKLLSNYSSKKIVQQKKW